MPQRRRRALLAALPLLPLLPMAGAALARAADAGIAPDLPRLGVPPGGRFESHARFPSRHVAARDVKLWLPPDYESGEPCAVLYMHDGQNLFAPANPFNHGPWDVDRHLLALRAQGRVRKTLVVGIDNAGADRPREYAPQAAIETLPDALRKRAVDGKPMADRYLRFLVEELKPFVDRHYRTRPGREHTALVGSSMGGLISLYALARHPGVFGAMGAISTHWPITVDHSRLLPVVAPEVETIAAAFLDWLARELPQAGRHRLYFDHGDQTLDAIYAPFQQRMDAIARGKGYRERRDLMSRAIPGASHDEAAWRARLATPLAFLLPPAS